MDALDALLTRSSFPKLKDPEPKPAVLENICRAAFRAADHGVLRPWRFLMIRGDARQRLGELFVEAMGQGPDAPDLEKAERLRQKPLRAPLILVVISTPVEHPKVPEFEQDLSAAAAAQSMLIAAYAQGVGAMWRTGTLAYNDAVKAGLGLRGAEKIIGFLYLGTIDCATKQVIEPPIADYFQEW